MEATKDLFCIMGIMLSNGGSFLLINYCFIVMKKKFNLLSLMLVGLLSFFTSCVDGDYYELYEDEEELLLPRDKKGKDVVNVDLSVYTMMDDGWYEAECIAICYSNIFGADVVTSRYRTIEAAYDSFNDVTYATYFAHVMYSNGVPTKAVKKLFGSSTFSVQKLAKYCKANDVGSDYSVEGNNWVVLANASDGPGTHVAKVTSLSLEPDGDGYKLTVSITDKNGEDHPRYILRLNKNKKFVSQDAAYYGGVNGTIEHFIGTCNY